MRRGPGHERNEGWLVGKRKVEAAAVSAGAVRENKSPTKNKHKRDPGMKRELGRKLYRGHRRQPCLAVGLRVEIVGWVRNYR